MADSRQYIAVDLGAESGRVMLGTVTAERLDLAEAHRFANVAVEKDDGLRWDFERLMSEITAGIGRAIAQSDGAIAGISVDSWGVDFGLIDEAGELIENPYHYRDSRTEGMLEQAFELMGRRAIYDHSGIQMMQINSVYQLLALRLGRQEVLRRAKSLIFMADLVAYHLCGEVFAEYCLASTSQMMDMQTGQWSGEIFDKLKLPMGIMPEIVPAGTVVGHLTGELAGRFGCEPIPIIAAGSHDTACAVAGVPVSSENWAYLSSGTWSLMGLEVPRAIVNDKTFEYQFTNEGGVKNSVRLLKNIMGLWVVQQCRQYWRDEGVDWSYGQLTERAEKSKPFAGHIDPDSHDFLSPGDMPTKVNDYLRRTGQEPADDAGQMVRIVLESLALKYRWVLDRLEDVQGCAIEVLHIVGGGIQNELLCQFAANATGKKVIAGPVEATASGSVIMQAVATGQIESLAQGREIVGESYSLKEYVPQEQVLWLEQYRKIKWYKGSFPERCLGEGGVIDD